MVLRYRRSAGEERLQLKWFAYAVAVSIGLTLLLLPTSTAGGAGQVAYDASIVAGFGVAVPVAIGVAGLKYRLYAIDRLISSTYWPRPACRCGCGIRPEGVRGEAGRADSPVRYQRF